MKKSILINIFMILSTVSIYPMSFTRKVGMRSLIPGTMQRLIPSVTKPTTDTAPLPANDAVKLPTDLVVMDQKDTVVQDSKKDTQYLQEMAKIRENLPLLATVGVGAAQLVGTVVQSEPHFLLGLAFGRGLVKIFVEQPSDTINEDLSEDDVSQDTKDLKNRFYKGAKVAFKVGLMSAGLQIGFNEGYDICDKLIGLPELHDACLDAASPLESDMMETFFEEGTSKFGSLSYDLKDGFDENLFVQKKSELDETMSPFDELAKKRSNDTGSGLLIGSVGSFYLWWKNRTKKDDVSKIAQSNVADFSMPVSTSDQKDK